MSLESQEKNWDGIDEIRKERGEIR